MTQTSTQTTIQTATQTIPVFMGSVNRWECDENDHQNVRFYAQKMHQTLESGLLALGLIEKHGLAAIGRSISSQHMRYVAEARVAAPITGYFGLLEVNKTSFTVLTELRNTESDVVMAAYVHQIMHTLDVASPGLVELPAHAGHRGIEKLALPFSDWDIQKARAHGFQTIGRGCIQIDEVCLEGYLLPWLYMGKSSDSMPNLWAKFESTQDGRVRGDGITGGAVLEYQMDHHSKLKLSDRFEMVSGIRKLGEKTQHMIHLLFNLDSGQCVIACQAIGISMDLLARKSIPIPPEKRTAMEKLLINLE